MQADYWDDDVGEDFDREKFQGGGLLKGHATQSTEIRLHQHGEDSGDCSEDRQRDRDSRAFKCDHLEAANLAGSTVDRAEVRHVAKNVLRGR